MVAPCLPAAASNSVTNFFCYSILLNNICELVLFFYDVQSNQAYCFCSLICYCVEAVSWASFQESLALYCWRVVLSLFTSSFAAVYSFSLLSILSCISFCVLLFSSCRRWSCARRVFYPFPCLSASPLRADTVSWSWRLRMVRLEITLLLSLRVTSWVLTLSSKERTAIASCSLLRTVSLCFWVAVCASDSSWRMASMSLALYDYLLLISFSRERMHCSYELFICSVYGMVIIAEKEFVKEEERIVAGLQTGERMGGESGEGVKLFWGG